MSIHSITLDDFMQLTRQDHEVAVELYSVAIDEAVQYAAKAQGEANREYYLDRLTSLLQLRKLHKVHVAELKEAESTRPALTASEQYRQNELAPIA